MRCTRLDNRRPRPPLCHRHEFLILNVARFRCTSENAPIIRTVGRSRRERLAEALDEAERGTPVAIERRGIRYRLTRELPKRRRSVRAPRLDVLDQSVAEGLMAQTKIYEEQSCARWGGSRGIGALTGRILGVMYRFACRCPNPERGDEEHGGCHECVESKHARSRLCEAAPVINRRGPRRSDILPMTQ